jgi:hypothetical protein
LACGPRGGRVHRADSDGGGAVEFGSGMSAAKRMTGGPRLSVAAAQERGMAATVGWLGPKGQVGWCAAAGLRGCWAC